MLVIYLLWILIIILIVELILYEPLKPIDLFISDDEKGDDMNDVGNSLTKNLLIPRNAKILEITIYNDNQRNTIISKILQNTNLIGEKGIIAPKGFSNILIRIRRSFIATSQCTISLEESNKDLSNIKLKSVKAWTN